MSNKKTSIKLLQVFFCFAIVLSLLGCKNNLKAPDKEIVSGQSALLDQNPGPNIIRLVDFLPSATINSPLFSIKAATNLAAVSGEVKSSSVFVEDFEKFTPNKANWKPGAGCRISTRPENKKNLALSYTGSNPDRCVFILPAEPSTHYRFRRSVNTADNNMDFALMESRVRLNNPSKLNDSQDMAKALTGKGVAMADLIYVHRPKAPPADQTWQTEDLYIFTSPFTKSFVLQLQDAEGLLSANNRSAMFDDLSLAKLEPSKTQELALLKAFAPLEGPLGQTGIVKHGQMLPADDLSTLKAPFDHNYDYRPAILAAAPTTITWPLKIPPNARLRVSMALFKTSRLGDSVNFKVSLKTKLNQNVSLVTQNLTIEASRKDWHWFDVVVPLNEFAGQDVSLTLETTAPEGSRGYALWGDPVLDIPRRKSDPPNVIFIGADTLRADRMTCYGNLRPTSPNLDALAKDGSRFALAIAPDNWTSPAFASLFTGLMPSRHSVIHRARAIAPEIKTIAEYFRDEGYATHGIAYKAYLYNMGFEQGFDGWFNVPRPEAKADDNLNKIMEWLDKNGDRRFFLFLHFNDPHQPFDVPKDFAERFLPKGTLARYGITFPALIKTDGNFVNCSTCPKNVGPASELKTLGFGLYDAAVAFMDDRLGRLFSALKSRGIYDDTIIAFVSDHGEVMWEHNNFFGHGGPSLVDQLIHVPLIIKPAQTANFPKGQVIRQQVRTLDLMPTLLDLAGIAAPDYQAEGKSLLPLMQPKNTEPPSDRIAYSENIKHNVLSVRKPTWKYTLWHKPNRPISEQLIDLAFDPSEKQNLAPRLPETLAQFRHLVIEFLIRQRPGPYVLMTSDKRKRSFTLSIESDKNIRGVQTIYGGPIKFNSSKIGKRLIKTATDPLAWFGRLEVDALSNFRLNFEVDGEPGPKTSVSFKADVEAQAKQITSLLLAEQPAIEILAGAPPQKTGHRVQISGQQLEALKALGYIE